MGSVHMRLTRKDHEPFTRVVVVNLVSGLPVCLRACVYLSMDPGYCLQNIAFAGHLLCGYSCKSLFAYIANAGGQRGVLKLRSNAGRNLLAADKSGDSDPYVTLVVEGAADKKRLKSKVVDNNNVDPEWNQVCERDLIVSVCLSLFLSATFFMVGCLVLMDILT